MNKENEDLEKTAHEIANGIRNNFTLTEQNEILSKAQEILFKYRNEELEELEKKMVELRDSM